MSNKNYSHNTEKKETTAQNCHESKNRTEQKSDKNSMQNNMRNVTAGDITHTHSGENCGR